MKSWGASLVAGLLFCAADLRAQAPYRRCLDLSFSINSITSNTAFKRATRGIFHLNAAYDFRSKSGFYAGPVLAFGLFKSGNSRNSALPVSRTRFNFLMSGLNLGYEFNRTSSIRLALFSQPGYSQLITASGYCPGEPSGAVVRAGYWTADTGFRISFFTQDNLSFSLRASYLVNDFRFRPEEYCMDNFLHNGPFSENEKSARLQSLNIGLGFQWYFLEGLPGESAK